MGYSHRVWFRLTPGGTRDLYTLIASTKGPVRVELSHVPVLERAETINKKVVVQTRGFRAIVRLTFVVTGTMSEHATIRELANALMDGTTRVEISLDGTAGGGVTYRFCEIRSYDGPDAIQEKTIAGAIYRLEVEVEDLVAAIPTLTATGAW